MSVGIAVSKCWRKTTFDGRRHLMEDDLWQKTTFDGRRHLMEDDIWWKTTFDGRRPLTEDDFWRKTTFDGRRPLTEDDLWRKTTFDKTKLRRRSDYCHRVAIFGYGKAYIENNFSCILKGKCHKINAKIFSWVKHKNKNNLEVRNINFLTVSFLPHPIDRELCKQSNQVIHSDCCILHSSQLLPDNYTWFMFIIDYNSV